MVVLYPVCGESQEGKRKRIAGFGRGSPQPPPSPNPPLAHALVHGRDALRSELLGLLLERVEEDRGAVHQQARDLLTVVPREDRVPEDRLAGEDAGPDVEGRVVHVAQDLLVAPQQDVLHAHRERLHHAAPDVQVHGREGRLAVQGDDLALLGQVSGDLDGVQVGVLHGRCLCPCGAVWVCGNYSKSVGEVNSRGREIR